jgi:hypothetical protein
VNKESVTPEQGTFFRWRRTAARPEIGSALACEEATGAPSEPYTNRRTMARWNVDVVAPKMRWRKQLGGIHVNREGAIRSQRPVGCESILPAIKCQR